MTEEKKEKVEAPEEAQKELSREEELSAEVEKLKEQLLRTLAELENYRKRAEREREEMAKYAVSGFAKDLLTVSDNLRRAIESISLEHDEPEALLKSLMEGVTITENELITVFKKNGIEKVDPQGKLFDHNYHQAMFELDDSDEPKGTVVQVLQPGYTLNGRLLRPALVGVSKGKNSGDPLQPSNAMPKSKE